MCYYFITANPGSTDQVLSAEGDYLDICDRSQHNMPKTSEVYSIYSYPFLIFTTVTAINTLLILMLSLQISVSSGHCGDPRRCLSSHYYFSLEVIFPYLRFISLVFTDSAALPERCPRLQHRTPCWHPWNSSGLALYSAGPSHFCSLGRRQPPHLLAFLTGPCGEPGPCLFSLSMKAVRWVWGGLSFPNIGLGFSARLSLRGSGLVPSCGWLPRPPVFSWILAVTGLLRFNLLYVITVETEARVNSDMSIQLTKQPLPLVFRLDWTQNFTWNQNVKKRLF